MKKIITQQEAIKISGQLHQQGKSIVLVGGCFDLLHPGHMAFLDAARTYGDILVVLLESDESVRIKKGLQRPINNQKNRAKALLQAKKVDLVVLLENVLTDAGYDHLVLAIKPAIIATTKKDPYIGHKKRQAKLVSGKVSEVIHRLPPYSTSALVEQAY